MKVMVREPQKGQEKHICYNVVDGISSRPKLIYTHSAYQVMGDEAHSGQLEFARRLIRLKKE